MSDPVLQLTGISKAYNRGQPGEVRVLNGVDLTVQPGEVVALVAAYSFWDLVSKYVAVRNSRC